MKHIVIRAITLLSCILLVSCASGGRTMEQYRRALAEQNRLSTEQANVIAELRAEKKAASNSRPRMGNHLSQAEILSETTTVTAVKKKANKKTLSMEERVARLENKVGNHERRLSKLEKVTNQMGEDLERIIKQAGGLNDIDYFTVKFRFDSSEVSEEMEMQISVLCKEYQKKAKENGQKIILTLEGYADQNGEEKYNKKLAQKRVNAVKPFFEKGLSENTYEINTVSVGEMKIGYTDANARIVRISHRFEDIKPITGFITPPSNAK